LGKRAAQWVEMLKSRSESRYTIEKRRKGASSVLLETRSRSGEKGRLRTKEFNCRIARPGHGDGENGGPGYLKLSAPERESRGLTQRGGDTLGKADGRAQKAARGLERF